MKLRIKYCLALLAIIGICSCAHYKDVPYFQNATEFDGTKGARLYDLTVKPKDELTIFVFSGNDIVLISAWWM